MKKLLFLPLTLLLGCGLLQAQVADTARWHVHLTTGAGVSSGFGRVQGTLWTAADLELHPTDRLTVNTGFGNIGSMVPTELKGYNNRSLAPRRTGTQATALWAEAEYQVNDRLWLWGAVSHISGCFQPLWLNSSLPLQATSFIGGFGYRFSEGSSLEMHFHVVHDNYGTLAPMLYHDPLYDPFYSGFSGFSRFSR